MGSSWDDAGIFLGLKEGGLIDSKYRQRLSNLNTPNVWWCDSRSNRTGNGAKVV